MTALQVADWRRRNFALYAAIRENPDAASAHADWRAGRDEMFATHPASPLLPEDLRGFKGLPFESYNPDWRFEASIVPGDGRRRRTRCARPAAAP